ncbi:hypothetical protein ACUN0C_19390 [Faunimonas sp. B44]|uniref:hypothetical protein n=1 Tax=Faunimonas sp. B44 TaxID=3461493 RepID=UPI004043F7B2
MTGLRVLHGQAFVGFLHWSRGGAERMAERLVTDIGGFEAGEIPMEDHHQLFWEKQLMATYFALQDKGVLVSDEFRRKVEEMPEAEYKSSSFYGRRAHCIAQLLVEKHIFSASELEGRRATILRLGTRDHVG